MLPTTPDARAPRRAGTARGDAIRRAAALLLWADWTPCSRPRLAPLRGSNGPDEPETIEDTSHFLQEDAGEAIGRRIADWLTGR